jgi:hypothetical protein
MRKAIVKAVTAIAATWTPTPWRTPPHDAPRGMPSVSTSHDARRLQNLPPTAQSPLGRDKSNWSPKQVSIRRIAAGLVAAMVAIGASVLTAQAATAAPCMNNVPMSQACQACLSSGPNDGHLGARCFGQTPAAPPRNNQSPTRAPVQTPQAPPPQSTVPVQTPQVKPPPPPPPTVMPVQTPKINPPGPGAPKNASLVTPPKALDAPQQAVAAAKSAPPTRINPVTPPTPSTHVDFNHQVQNVVSAHSGNVDVVKADNQALTRPRRWDFVDYDTYHRPALYNPLDQAMTFRYFYNGAFRELTVPAGGRAVLDVATVGMFPFTAVSDSYLASGSFNGGAWIPPDGWDGPPPPDYTPPAAPEVYQNVSANVPADNQTVQVGQVTVIGHDDSQPTGSQDTFILDDSTLAWGQVNPANGAQISVTKTQSLPGVGPTDNGSFLVALTAHEQPTDNTSWLWPLGGVVLVIAAGLITWIVIRRKQNVEVEVSD